MACLSEVVGVIDMDGFQINKRFYCKELGIIELGDVSARSFFFDIGVRWNELSREDKKTWQYTIRKIHKLPFGVPRGVNTKKTIGTRGHRCRCLYSNEARWKGAYGVQGHSLRETCSRS